MNIEEKQKFIEEITGTQNPKFLAKREIWLFEHFTNLISSKDTELEQAKKEIEEWKITYNDNYVRHITVVNLGKEIEELKKEKMGMQGVIDSQRSEIAFKEYANKDLRTELDRLKEEIINMRQKDCEAGFHEMKDGSCEYCGKI